MILDTDASQIVMPVISVKLRPENRNEAMEFIESKWRKIYPMEPFEYTYLEDRIENQYMNEEHLIIVFNYFLYLCISISCLGLFALSSFIAEKKTKEIGIRKIHGASVLEITYKLAVGFIKLVINSRCNSMSDSLLHNGGISFKPFSVQDSCRSMDICSYSVHSDSDSSCYDQFPCSQGCHGRSG